MIHIVCYLRGGDPGREGRQLWSAAWPPCTTLGLPRWPACLSVWSSGSHPPLVVLIAPLFITLLSSTSAPPTLILLCSPLLAHLPPSSPLISPPLLLALLLPTTTLLLLFPPPCLPSQALHWIFHHKPPAACQSQRTLPPEAPTEGPASDIKRGIKA